MKTWDAHAQVLLIMLTCWKSHNTEGQADTCVRSLDPINDELSQVHVIAMCLAVDKSNPKKTLRDATTNVSRNLL